MAEAAAVIDNQQTAIFELQVKHLREHVDAHERVNDAKFDRIEALMARNLAEQKAMIGEIRSEVREMGSRMSRMESDINGLKDDINNIKDDITGLKVEMSEVKDDIKTLKDSIDTFEKRLPWNLALMGIITVVLFTVIQHFWK